MKNIVVLGQTPPPIGGQAVMIEIMLSANFDSELNIIHVPMKFSKDMDEIGRFNINKITHLIDIIIRIIKLKIKDQTDVLYYPPAGPKKIPIYRDIILLTSIRWMFKKTIFHFHASGLTTIYDELNTFVKFLFKQAYNEPDLTIRTSYFNPNDGELINTKRDIVIYNGVPDSANLEFETLNEIKSDDCIKLLFVGLICKSKGVEDLIKAAKILLDQNYKIKVYIMGKFESETYKKRLLEIIEVYSIQDHVQFLGVKSGSEKNYYFKISDIFVFPSYFEAESFGLVLIEAMSFSLPIVGTKWRGLQEVIENGKNGYLVEVKDYKNLASKLENLINDPKKMIEMGRHGRKKFEIEYTVEKFRNKMANIFKEV